MRCNNNKGNSRCLTSRKGLSSCPRMAPLVAKVKTRTRELPQVPRLYSLLAKVEVVIISVWRKSHWDKTTHRTTKTTLKCLACSKHKVLLCASVCLERFCLRPLYFSGFRPRRSSQVARPRNRNEGLLGVLPLDCGRFPSFRSRHHSGRSDMPVLPVRESLSFSPPVEISLSGAL